MLDVSVSGFELERRFVALLKGDSWLRELTKGNYSHSEDISLLKFLGRLKEGEFYDGKKVSSLEWFVTDFAADHVQRLLGLPAAYCSTVEGRNALISSADTLKNLVDQYDSLTEERYHVAVGMPSHRFRDENPARGSEMWDRAREFSRMQYHAAKEVIKDVNHQIYRIESMATFGR
ncbi:MAG: hypothetical protein AABX51_01400 [Nanoarchaeota archaeon]|mgnify:CR=1 FL=1